MKNKNTTPILPSSVALHTGVSYGAGLASMLVEPLAVKPDAGVGSVSVTNILKRYLECAWHVSSTLSKEDLAKSLVCYQYSNKGYFTLLHSLDEVGEENKLGRAIPFTQNKTNWISGSGSLAGEYLGIHEYWNESGVEDFKLESVSNPQSEKVNLLEVELARLQTVIIEQKRALLVAQRESREISERYDKLLDATCDMAETNKSLQNALFAKYEGRICLYESVKGVATKVIGDQVQITFEASDGPINQIYRRSQFLREKAPDVGEGLNAYVFLAYSTNDVNSENENIMESEPRDFRQYAKSTPLIVD